MARVKSPDSSQLKNTTAGVLAAIAGEVPVLGAIVGTLQAGLSARQRERDEEFFAMVAASERMTDERVRAIAAGDDDEFVASAHRIVREAQATADEGKRQLLASVLANSGSWSTVSLDEREELLPTVIQMTPVQVRLLDFLDDPRAWLARHDLEVEAQPYGISSRGAIIDKYFRNAALGQLADAETVSYQDLAAVAAELERLGLATPNLNTMMTPNGALDSCTTPRGKRILAYIRG